jgi:hypothetical protein
VPKHAPSFAAPTIASLVLTLVMLKAWEMPSMAPPISPRSYLACFYERKLENDSQTGRHGFAQAEQTGVSLQEVAEVAEQVVMVCAQSWRMQMCNCSLSRTPLQGINM